MAFIYLIKENSDEEKYKIGLTTAKDITKRIKQLQTGASNELFVVNYFKTETPFTLEKMLHSKFKNKNTINEWFALSSEDVINFKSTCEELEKVIDSLKDNPFFVRK